MDRSGDLIRSGARARPESNHRVQGVCWRRRGGPSGNREKHEATWSRSGGCDLCWSPHGPGVSYFRWLPFFEGAVDLDDHLYFTGLATAQWEASSRRCTWPRRDAWTWERL